MAQSNKICEICHMLGHSKFYCKNRPMKSIKRSPIKATTKKKPKRTDRAKAKDKAWDAFSAYIRTRDCLRFTGSRDEGMCITCKLPKPYKELQAGHFIGGRGNAVLFDERIVYSQCGYCNQKPPMGLGGNYVQYTLFMLDEWGREMVDEFTLLRKATKVYKTHDFMEIEQLYKAKEKELTT